VGAYVLDALPEDERRAFEAHLSTCPTCRQGVAELAPVVSLLGRRYDAEPAPAADLVPSADLRGRILAAAQAQPNAAAATQPAAAGEPAWATWPRPEPATPPAAPSTGQIVSLQRPRWIATGWPAAAVLALFATGVVIWGLSLQTQLNASEADLAVQRGVITEQAAEIEQLRQRAATAFALAPTADGPSAAAGNLLYANQDHFGVLYVQGLPELPPGKVYQLWYVVGETPLPGGTFEVNPQGVGSLALTQDVQTVPLVALTVEPDGGSEAPTSAILLAGQNETLAG
jgi:hypothetical protein